MNSAVAVLVKICKQTNRNIHRCCCTSPRLWRTLLMSRHGSLAKECIGEVLHAPGFSEIGSDVILDVIRRLDVTQESHEGWNWTNNKQRVNMTWSVGGRVLGQTTPRFASEWSRLKTLQTLHPTTQLKCSWRNSLISRSYVRPTVNTGINHRRSIKAFISNHRRHIRTYCPGSSRQRKTWVVLRTMKPTDQLFVVAGTNWGGSTGLGARYPLLPFFLVSRITLLW